MTVIDAYMLSNPYNADAAEHTAARAWMEAMFARRDWIALPWLTLWAFLRISTNARAFPRPMGVTEAFDIVRSWLASPNVIVFQPEARHDEILQKLAVQNQAGGPLMTDAALAALAMEHGAVLASTDRDFSRFPDLRWLNPLQQSAT